MATIVAEVHAVTDITYYYFCLYIQTLQLAQAIHSLHMSDMLGYDEDGSDDVGFNDIDTLLISPMNNLQ